MSVLYNKIDELFNQYIDGQLDNTECVETLNLIKQEVLQSIQNDYTSYSKRVAIIKTPYKSSKGGFVIHNSLESAAKFISKESRKDETTILENLTKSGKAYSWNAISINEIQNINKKGGANPYNTIINPLTNTKVDINSKLGKSIIDNYYSTIFNN